MKPCFREFVHKIIIFNHLFHRKEPFLKNYCIKLARCRHSWICYTNYYRRLCYIQSVQMQWILQHWNPQIHVVRAVPSQFKIFLFKTNLILALNNTCNLSNRLLLRSYFSIWEGKCATWSKRQWFYQWK